MRRLRMAALAVFTLGVVASCGDDDVDIEEGERTAPSGMLTR